MTCSECIWILDRANQLDLSSTWCSNCETRFIKFGIGWQIDRSNRDLVFFVEDIAVIVQNIKNT